MQPDFVGIAKACACFGERVERPEEIKSAWQKALKANTEGVPAVLEFIVDPWDFPLGFRNFYKRLG